jgi:hypothetical protein
MVSRMVAIPATLLVLWMILIACASPTPPPPAVVPTLDTDYFFTDSLVVAETVSLEQGIHLIPYPSADTRYDLVQIQVIQDPIITKMDEAGREVPATPEDIVPNSRLEVAGEERVMQENGVFTGIALLARRILIVEAGTAPVPASPAPVLAEVNSPTPVVLETPIPDSMPRPAVTMTPCDACGPEGLGGTVQFEAVVTHWINGPTTTRLVLMPTSAYAYNYVLVSSDTTITFEDQSAATLADIPPDTIIDVVGISVGGPDILAEYLTILDPVTANPPPYYDVNTVLPTAYP